jgi:hypothetical protein
MFYLKKKVTNKATVEGSICEAYLIDEISILHLVILVMTCKQFGIKFYEMMMVALKV